MENNQLLHISRMMNTILYNYAEEVPQIRNAHQSGICFEYGDFILYLLSVTNRTSFETKHTVTILYKGTLVHGEGFSLDKEVLKTLLDKIEIALEKKLEELEKSKDFNEELLSLEFKL